MKELTVYIKPTNYCSVDCEHCYLPVETRADKTTISEDKLRKVFYFSKEIAKREGYDYVMLIWHGGEPMMLHPDWYEKAHVIADECFGDTTYHSTIQTSLIPYSEKWNEVIKKRFNNFVGTSIDFKTRTFKGSNEKYLDTFMKRIHALDEAKIDCIPGFVPSRQDIPHASKIVDWFIDNDFYRFNFERYTNLHNKNDMDYPSNLSHSKFMIDMFDKLMEIQEQTGKAPIVNPIIPAIRGVAYGIPGERWGTTCQSAFIIVEPNGNLNTCPDRAMHEEPFSNIDDGVSAFQRSPLRRKWIRVSGLTHKGEHCSQCEYRDWCQSGCPITPNSPEDKFHKECSGYKTFLNHIKKYLASNKREVALSYLQNG